jgi:chromosome segregation ATPase
MFDDIFGGMFDFNGDGHTDFLEEATGLAFLNKMMEEDNESKNDNVVFIDTIMDSYDDTDEISVEDKDDLRDEIESEISELEDELDDLEFDEPEDELLHEEWEEKVDELEEQISELEDKLDELDS